MIKFRTEKAYGDGDHSPAEILAYETLVLENYSILEDLFEKVKHTLNDKEINEIKRFIELLDKGEIYADEDSYLDHLNIFKNIILGLERLHNMKINYLLWLADIDDVIDLYYPKDEYRYLNDIDAYETGVSVIDVGSDGVLYAYQNKPESLDRSIVKQALDTCNKLYKVYVYNGVGVELQTLYFDHPTISIEEIGAACLLNNQGQYFEIQLYEDTVTAMISLGLTEDKQDKLGDLVKEKMDELFNDQEYAYIDLSAYNLSNIMLCITNMKWQDGVEIFS